jgi:hypothetical protein
MSDIDMMQGSKIKAQGIRNQAQELTSKKQRSIDRKTEVLSRLHPLDYEEAARHWTRSTKAEDEDEAEAKEALINR